MDQSKDQAAIMDRMELFAELTLATDRGLLNDYLVARRDYELAQPGRGEARMRALANNPRAGILCAHALYVLGAIQYDDQHFAQAEAIFAALAQRYPRSRRREAALLMIPRTLLRVPDVDDSFSEWVGKSLGAANALRRSRHALWTLLHEYPHTRFRQSALAWLARCDYLQGRRVAALEAYLHQYMTFRGDPDRESAAVSVLFVSSELTAKEAKQLRGDLRRKRMVLGDYLEYRLDHGSVHDADWSRLVDLATKFTKNQRLRL
jgi:hypothetical protein